MRIVIIGGSGLIGTKLVNNLRQLGHEVVAASRSSGVNTLSRRAGVTFWLRKLPLAWDITSRCRLSVPSAFWRAVTSAQRWPKKT